MCNNYIVRDLNHETQSQNFKVNLTSEADDCIDSSNAIATCVRRQGRTANHRLSINQIQKKIPKSRNKISSGLNMVKNERKRRLKRLDGNYFNSPKNGVVKYNDSHGRMPIKSIDMSKKRVKLIDSNGIGVMCKEEFKVDLNITPQRGSDKNILDFLMNRDNCLNEIDGKSLKGWCSVSTPINKLHDIGVSKAAELNNENLSVVSTTDQDSNNYEFDKINGIELFDQCNEVELDVDPNDLSNTPLEVPELTSNMGMDVMESAGASVEQIVDVNIDEETNVVDDNELVKCILDREYFNQLESVPAISILDKPIMKRLIELLSQTLGDLTMDGSLRYKLFVLNLCMHILKNHRFNVEDVFSNLLCMLKLASAYDGPFNQSNTHNSIEEELFVSILDNCIYLVNYLNPDEMLTVFKVSFSYFYNSQLVEIVMLKAFEICKDIITRLHVGHTQLVLKFVSASIVYFNNNMYHYCCNINKNDEICEINANERQNVENNSRVINELGNKNFVNVVIFLFERIFMGRVKDGVSTYVPELEGQLLLPENEEPYELFRRCLNSFIDETFYRENVEFKNYKIFLQTILRNLENPAHIFTPFLVLEMGKTFNRCVAVEDGAVKRGLGDTVGKNDFIRLQSYKLLLVISKKVFALCNQMFEMSTLNWFTSKYLNIEANTVYNRTLCDPAANNNAAMSESNVSLQYSLPGLKEYIANYVGYISIDNSHLDSDNAGLYVFYVMLKHYCHVNNVQDVEDLSLFIKVFQHLFKNNMNYKGDIDKILSNINYVNVINYPYSPYVTQSSSTDANMDSFVIKAYLLYSLYELHDLVFDSVFHIINDTNENGLLKLSIDALSEITLNNSYYLLNFNVRNLLLSSLSDYNSYVRHQIISIYSNLVVKLNSRSLNPATNTQSVAIKKPGLNSLRSSVVDDLVRYIDRELLNKILVCTKDVNYKIRLESTKLLHFFLSIVGIKDHMDVVSILAQRSLDSYREHLQVKTSLYNLLSSIFFKYALQMFIGDARNDVFSPDKNTLNNESIIDDKKTALNDNTQKHKNKKSVKRKVGATRGSRATKAVVEQKNGYEEKGATTQEDTCKQLMSDDNFLLLLKLVKIILYKMESYKGNINPIVILINYYDSNPNVINDPIGYYNSSGSNKQVGSDVKRGTAGRNNASSVVAKHNEGASEPRSSEYIVTFWLDGLLDLFLYKRAGGCDYYELAEILSVFKLFGEVYPRLFVKHLVYFIPYLKIINDTKLDVNQINLIILINNLVILVYRYLKNTKDGNKLISGKSRGRSRDKKNLNAVDKDNDIFLELNSINNTVMTLINYNSPILIGSIIQLMSYTNKDFVKKIYEVSHNYLLNLKKVLLSCQWSINECKQSGSREDFDELRIGVLNQNKMLVDINVYKNAWQLGCVCEFNCVELKILKLFVDMFKLYSSLGVYNISGLFIECSCRYLSNLDNLLSLKHEELKSVLNELYDFCLSDLNDCGSNLILVLYQLLSTYQILTTNSGDKRNSGKNIQDTEELENLEYKVKTGKATICTISLDDKSAKNKPVRGRGSKNKKNVSKGTKLVEHSSTDRKQLLNLMYVAIQKYIGVFISTVSNYYDVKPNQQSLSDMNLDDKIVKSEFKDTKKLFSVNGKASVADKSTLYMDIIEIIVVNRLTNVQEMVPFVFSHLLAGDSNVQRVAEHNLKLIIKQDVNLFINRLNSCFKALFYAIINQFFAYNFVLGLLGTNTFTAVQSIFRIYLEVLQTKRSNIKLFITSLLVQTKTIFDQQTIDSISWLVAQNDFNYNESKVEDEIYNNGGSSNTKGGGKRLASILSKLLAKIKTAREEEKKECVIEYLLYLYTNLVCVLLDGITFDNKKDANFAMEKISDVVEENYTNTKYSKINTFTQTRLKKISNKIKNIYK